INVRDSSKTQIKSDVNTTLNEESPTATLESGPRYCSPKCQTENRTKGHSSVCKAAHAGQLSNVESGSEGSVTINQYYRPYGCGTFTSWGYGKSFNELGVVFN
ncbi:2210_t:CDS:2, partial [Funneliformis geosporum]